MATDKQQISRLKQLVQDDGWDVLRAILAQHIVELDQQEITGNNEFETLRELHKKQGKVEGLAEFFDKVEKLDFDNN
jgi:hypothetical protein